MSLLSRLAVQAARAYGMLVAGSSTNVSADYLVVAGGGSGGGLGGGGAGGLLTSTATLSTLNTYSITVGAGGAPFTGQKGNNGSDSSISGTGLSTVTSTGGGGGGGFDSPNQNGNSGGSGGGGGCGANGPLGTGGAGTSGQGFAGGNPVSASPTTGNGAGGGGAGAVGSNSPASTTGGNGGAGSSSSISGSSVTYAGGGGGGAYILSGTGTAGTGGSGGGGNGGRNGLNPTAGTVNTGGGGGGAGLTSAGALNTAVAGGSGIVIISYTSATPKFVGGTITTSGGKQIHTFTSSGTLSPITPITASYLVVAGGGGGGAGGGGAGGLLTSSTTLYSGASYVVTVGAGGTAGQNTSAGANGSNSVVSGTGLSTLTATGGGRGGYFSAVAGASGGSGGGGGGADSGSAGAGGAGTSGQGNNGGTGAVATTVNGGGGGGGAGAAGGNATAGSNGGAGGVGVSSSISGTSTFYAGGGSGGCSVATAGGNGGGGAGGAASSVGSSGTPNTGGGGGGAGNTTGPVNAGSGGSGIVIISYAGSQQFNGGLVTTSGGNTIHTFTSTGALTPLTNNLTNSLRFRSSASAFLNRTPSVTGNQRTWTFSAWVKRGALSGGTQFGRIMSTQGSFGVGINFMSDDTLRMYFGGSAVLQTTQVFRDPSAWYHIVLAFDTTQATAANRVRLFVNGNQVTAFSSTTYPNQNDTFGWNNGSIVHQIGASTGDGATAYFDGYMDDIYSVDGQALEPYFFGNNDANGVWKPIQYLGTYGTNGFYLNFSNTTSTTTLGFDSSPNGNNWTTNNISLTAGVTYDAMTDVPTNTSATVANYPVYDQLTPSKVSGSGVRSISAANLYVTNSGPNGWSAIGTTMVMTSGSGKWYWEVTCSGTTSNGTMIGIHRPFTSTSTFPSEIIGYTGDADGYGYYMGGNKYNNSLTGVAYGASYTAGDVIGVALDMSTAGSASITFYKNNTSQGVAFSSLTGDFFAAVSQAQANGLDINFGQRPFAYTPPTGFVALNTFNLPTPTILQGNRFMDATLWTGNGPASQVIVNQAQFKPDMVWVKNRNSTRKHNIYDSVRGVAVGASYRLVPNLTSAEDNPAYGVTSMNSNGFTIGEEGDVNANGLTFVGWQWQAGQGSTSTNTSGSITSTVSVNTTAGFSIVTYTGTGANATVGHGLGVAPSFMVFKRRDAVAGWIIYHTLIGNTQYLDFTTAAATNGGSNTLAWNATSPTPTVFTLGTQTRANANNATNVAYCWADVSGYSKAFSYTGNGSADGVFVYLGFRPAFVMLKNSNTTDSWLIKDDQRAANYNPANGNLYPNLSDAEDTGSGANIDFLSNGFKVRGSNISVSGNGNTIIGMAFAEHPFKNSNAR